MSPDKVYGDKISKLMREYCSVIYDECKATNIQLKAEFTFKNNRGELRMQTFASPDSKTERLIDSNVLMPRGSKLQNDAILKARTAMTVVSKKTGGK